MPARRDGQMVSSLPRKDARARLTGGTQRLRSRLPRPGQAPAAAARERRSGAFRERRDSSFVVRHPCCRANAASRIQHAGFQAPPGDGAHHPSSSVAKARRPAGHRPRGVFRSTKRRREEKRNEDRTQDALFAPWSQPNAPASRVPPLSSTTTHPEPSTTRPMTRTGVPVAPSSPRGARAASQQKSSS